MVGVVGDGSDAAVSRHRRRRRRPQIVFFWFFVQFSSPTLSFTLLNLKNLKKYIYGPKSKVQKKYYLLKASFWFRLWYSLLCVPELQIPDRFVLLGCGFAAVSSSIGTDSDFLPLLCVCYRLFMCCYFVVSIGYWGYGSVSYGLNDWDSFGLRVCVILITGWWIWWMAREMFLIVWVLAWWKKTL